MKLKLGLLIVLSTIGQPVFAQTIPIPRYDVSGFCKDAAFPSTCMKDAQEAYDYLKNEYWNSEPDSERERCISWVERTRDVRKAPYVELQGCMNRAQRDREKAEDYARMKAAPLPAFKY